MPPSFDQSNELDGNQKRESSFDLFLQLLGYSLIVVYPNVEPERELENIRLNVERDSCYYWRIIPI